MKQSAFFLWTLVTSIPLACAHPDQGTAANDGIAYSLLHYLSSAEHSSVAIAIGLLLALAGAALRRRG